MTIGEMSKTGPSTEISVKRKGPKNNMKSYFQEQHKRDSMNIRGFLEIKGGNVLRGN